MTIGFDLDGVVCLLPFGFRQIYQRKAGEKVFWYFQYGEWLLRLYNLLFRRPNQEIQQLMRLLKNNGYKIIIVSAASEKCRREVMKWLQYHQFCFDVLHLRNSLLESVVAFKKRILKKENCCLYLEDKKEIVKKLNLFANPYKVLFYRPGKLPEVFKSLLK